MKLASDKLRVEMLFRQGVPAQIAGLVNVGIYSFCIHNLVSQSSLIFWVGTALVLTLGRVFVQNWFLKNIIKRNLSFSPKLWENIFSLGTLSMGALWGFAGTFMLPENSVAHYAFLGFILAGNTSGAAVAYVTSVRASQTFLLPSIIPFAINMLWQGGELPSSMALLLIIYVALVTVASRKMNIYVIESLEIRHQKSAVTTELGIARAKVTESAKMAALGEMAGGIAHEINNPLAIIRGCSGILKSLTKAEGSNPTKALELIEKIDSTTVRIAKIVSGLRMFSRDAGKDPLETVPLKLIISQTLDFCQSRFKSRGIPLHIEPIDEQTKIICRSAQISQVLLNLLNNSFDAIKDQTDPWVRVQIETVNHKVIVSVTDSGSGIPREIQAKLMEPFFTTKKVGEGTGLGLSVAHGIMQGHGGTLKLDTECENTRFMMEFSKAA